MMRIELDAKQRQMLETLTRGAMSPSALSAETLILPGEAADLLKSLEADGLVLIRDDNDSADGKLVALSVEARDLLEKTSIMRQTRG